MPSGPTKAALVQQLAEVREQRDQAIAYQPSDKEAAAIARCVKALEPIANQRSHNGYIQKDSPEVRRVLHYLAARHGFTLHDHPQVDRVETYTICRSCRCEAMADDS